MTEILGPFPAVYWMQVHSGPTGRDGTQNVIGTEPSRAEAEFVKRYYSILQNITVRLVVKETTTIAYQSFWDAPTGGKMVHQRPVTRYTSVRPGDEIVFYSEVPDPQPEIISYDDEDETPEEEETVVPEGKFLQAVRRIFS